MSSMYVIERKLDVVSEMRKSQSLWDESQE